MNPNSIANACLLALQFLTRIPVKTSLNYAPEAMGLSVLFFPLVGLIIGGCLYATSLLLTLWGDLLTAIIITLVWLWLTGGLHIDGLADTVDAWVGGHGDKEKTLRIMKDPAIGPMGVLAILAIVLLKISTIMLILSRQQTWLLLWIPMMSRWQLVVLLMTTPYAKETGLGKLMQQYAPITPLWILLCLSLLLMILLFPLALSLAYLVSWGGLIYYRHHLLNRIAGTTGDTAGAWVEISEALLLLLVISLSAIIIP